MFDHVTVRIPDLAAALPRFQAIFDPLSMDQTVGTRAFAGFGNFLITEPDDQHPLTHRAHVAFVAPTTGAVDEFWAAGQAEGLRDDGPPGPRDYAPDYYAAFLRDERDNSFEAVNREGPRRDANIEHVKIRVADVAAARDFYTRLAAILGHELEGFYFGDDGKPTVGLHLAFGGDDEQIRRFYDEQVAAGYRDFGGPGERARYHPGYYAAYVLDPDGNNVEVVDHHR